MMASKTLTRGKGIRQPWESDPRLSKLVRRYALLPSAQELLDEYEHHLDFFLKWMRKRRRCEPEEADVVLFTREDLWEALKQKPDGLSKEERLRLRELDRTLKANAKLMAKALPELPQIRRRLKPPKSHWWWYLDRIAQRQ